MTVAARLRACTHAVSPSKSSPSLPTAARLRPRPRHTPGRDFAKAVVIPGEKGSAIVVVPAHPLCGLAAHSAIGQPEAAALATKDEIARLCPGFERGAVPPFGQLYWLAVVLSDELSRAPRIIFNARSHCKAIRMSYHSFATVVKTRVAHISSISRDGDPSSRSPTRS